jgi:hypothetical protein
MRGDGRQPAGAAQGATGENIEGAGLAQTQPFNEVKTVQLGVTGWQIPAGWRCRMPAPSLAIHETLSVQDPVNGAHARRGPRQQGLECGLHRNSARETKVILGELTANPAYSPLYRSRSLRGIALGPGGAIGPIDQAQRRASCTAHPELHCGETHAKMTGDAASRKAFAVLSDDLLSHAVREFFSPKNAWEKMPRREHNAAARAPLRCAPFSLG